jgi:uncharacterized integral membrane protein
MTDNSSIVRVDRPNRWIGPVTLLAFIVAVIVIFIASNSGKATVGFAGWEWHDVPVWLVIVISTVVGAIGGPLLGWAWRAWRRHRRRLADELDMLHKHAAGSEG